MDVELDFRTNIPVKLIRETDTARGRLVEVIKTHIA